MSLLSLNLKEEMDGDCLISSDKLCDALIVDGKRNYSISLCQHGEFVCHQHSVVCN